MANDIEMTKGNLVVIYWLDTIEVSSWTQMHSIRAAKPALAKSVGWLFSEDDECVKLLTSVIGTQDSDMEAGYTVIPKATIKRIEPVREDELDVE